MDSEKEEIEKSAENNNILFRIEATNCTNSTEGKTTDKELTDATDMSLVEMVDIGETSTENVTSEPSKKIDKKTSKKKNKSHKSSAAKEQSVLQMTGEEKKKNTEIIKKKSIQQEQAKKTVSLGKRSADSPMTFERNPPKDPKINENPSMPLVFIENPPPLFNGELFDDELIGIAGGSQQYPEIFTNFDNSAKDNVAETLPPKSVPPHPPATAPVPAQKVPVVARSAIVESSKRVPAGPKKPVKKSVKSISSRKKSSKPKNHKSGKRKSADARKTKRKEKSAEIKELKRCVVKLTEQVEKLANAITPGIQRLIDNWEQLKSTPVAEGSTRGNRLQDIGMHPHPGFLRIEDQMMHAGQGIWIHKRQYDNAKINAKSNSIFVRNILLAIFDVHELLTSSVCGAPSNAIKVQDRKPPLDPTKLVAVSDIFRFYLEEKGYKEEDIAYELAACTSYIRAKISDMTRKPTILIEEDAGGVAEVPRRLSDNGTHDIDNGEDLQVVESEDSTKEKNSEDSSSDSGTESGSESSTSSSDSD